MRSSARSLTVRRIFRLLAASLLLHLLAVSGEEDPTPTTFYDDTTDWISYVDFEIICHPSDVPGSCSEFGSGSSVQPGYVTLISVLLCLICYVWH